MDGEIQENYETLCGQCPDTECNNTLYFFSTTTLIICPSCGQEHPKDSLLNVSVLDKKKDLAKMVKGYLANLGMPHKGTEFVKVNGLSNFQCKLLSPLLTLYGMDKEGRPRLLTDLGHSEIINCGKLIGNRTFQISSHHTNINGYGKDQSGSLKYLEGFLDILKEHHKGEEVLIPLHADGDGHCLVHAVSRALIGRELFWHGLRKNLQNHLKAHLSDYKELFKEFHDEDEWESLIEEADPFNCSGGITGGLGNIHIFALSNTLQRPIMLIDMPKNMQKVGDYSGLFVPVLNEPKLCLEKSPICIAWSGAAHNHFVPLVPIEGKTLPTVPKELIPNVWGVPQEKANSYLEYNEDGSLTIGKGKPLKTSYLLKLARAMESAFQQHHEVSPSLVEDFYQYVHYPRKYFSIQPHQMTSVTKSAYADSKIRKCLDCKALQEVQVTPAMLKPGGCLYDLVIECHRVPKTNKQYTFQSHKIVCNYNEAADMLVVANSECSTCKRYATRMVDRLGNIVYHNGDPTDTPTVIPTKCNCKYKHYWNGIEYDNLPEKFTMTLEWEGKSYTADVLWFYGDSNPELNSKPQEEAQRIVHANFGSSGTESLVLQLTTCLESKDTELNREVALHQEESVDGSILLDSIKTESSKQASGLDDSHPSTSLDNIKIVEKATPVQSAFKRKSNGQPIVSDSPQSSQSKEKVNVKISTCKGQKKTFKLQPQTTVKDLNALVQSCFHIPEDRQILKYGFPPQILSGTGVIELKSGDQIKVDEKTAEPKDKPVEHSPVAKSSSSSSSYNDIASTTGLFAKLEQLKAEFVSSNMSTMWDYCCGMPHLFLPGGVFYQQFEIDIGLKHGGHCSFPLIPDRRFQFNEKHNRIELCLEPVGHFPVDSDILQVIKKFATTNVNDLTSGKVQDIKTSGIESTENLSNDVQPGSSRLAPGFFTVGDQPTTLTADEIDSQRNELREMVKRINDLKK
uniref:ubiquitinyl hydrolase 1 n=1 Tax=Phallusia mammillata TaxID=59560 RepID=A0A6F9DVX8_9ASCI|nr:deubiquitinating protein VCIP135-like [Phallusia mammillata]